MTEKDEGAMKGGVGQENASKAIFEPSGVIPERHVAIVRRAEARIQEIQYESRQLDNEEACLRAIIRAAVLGFDDEVEVGKRQYRNYFTKKK